MARSCAVAAAKVIAIKAALMPAEVASNKAIAVEHKFHPAGRNSMSMRGLKAASGSLHGAPALC